ncbi:MAG: type II toxin-antitoxin system RelE/ParE family toxin [Phycisphaerales bacterium]
MARYELLIKPSAGRELARLGTKQDRQRIVTAIRGLAEQPRPVGCEKLAGADDLYRIRIGDYRVVYEILDAELVITVVKVGHRRDVYR